MKFPSLEITNFLAITQATFNLADRGLVLVEGVNSVDTSAKSNGAGKSSIADALCWCWFGTTARGITGDDVINNDAGKGTIVTSTLFDNNLTYTASRHRKHKTGKNTLTLSVHNGIVATDLTKGTDKLTQEVADKIIGASLEVFSGSIYAGQERMPDLPSMTDKVLKMLIEEAAGVTVLEEAYKLAREAALAVQVRLETVSRDYEKSDARKGFAQNNLTAQVASIATWSSDQAAKMVAVMDSVRNDIMPALNAAKAVADALDIPALDAAIADCDAKINAVSGEQVQMRVLAQDVSDKTALVAAADSICDGAERSVTARVQALANIEHKIGCPCNECGRPLTLAEMGAAKTAAKDALTLAEDEALELAKRCRTARQALKAATGARDAFAASLTDLTTVAHQRGLLINDKAQAGHMIAHRDACLRNALDAKKIIEGLTAAINPYIAGQDVAKAEIEACEKELEILAKKIEEVEAEKKIETEVVKLFSPAGVRARVLDEVTPFLNVQTERYLNTLSDGNMEAMWSTLTRDSKGALKEKFTIDVTNKTGASIFKGLSGGEKRKVRIATALALQDLVATRATKPIDLFIGDEIDDALDVAGIERLMSVLEDKARERGTVLIISHNEIRDMCKNVLTIEKTAGGTVVTENGI